MLKKSFAKKTIAITSVIIGLQFSACSEEKTAQSELILAQMTLEEKIGQAPRDVISYMVEFILKEKSKPLVSTLS